MFHQSGQPIPRFVSLKSGEVNMRVGPGKHFPIEWVYKREAYPMEVIEEFGHWRKVRDIENTQGWIHYRLLVSKRTAIVQPANTPLIPIYSSNSATSRIVLEAEPGVMLTLHACDTIWCQASVRDYQGWIEKKHLWGVYTDEEFSP